MKNILPHFELLLCSIGLFLAGVLPLLFNGCATPTLEFNAAPIPETLDLAASNPVANVTLKKIISMREPKDMWRFWDEYALTLQNLSSASLTIVSVQVIDRQGKPQSGINDWDKLGLASRTIWVANTTAGIPVTPDLETLFGPECTWHSDHFYKKLSDMGGIEASMLLACSPIVVPLVVYNKHTTKKTLGEMERRRITIPCALSPKQSVSGSVYFPMIPGPQQLVVRVMTATEPVELIIGLTPLAGLHLKRVASPTAQISR